MRGLFVAGLVLLYLVIGTGRASGQAEPPRPGTWTTLTTTDGLPDNDVRVIFEDRDGRLWFGTRNHGLGVYDGTAWTYTTTADGLVANGILAIIQDDDGAIWFATAGGASRYVEP